MATDPVGARPPRRGVGPFSLRQVSLVAAAVVITAVGVSLATAPLGTTGPNLPVPGATAYLVGSPVPGLRVGDLAPELTVPDGAGGTFTLTDLDGAPIRLADLRGRAVWLDFWASWCPPCQSETPTIRAMDEAYRDRGLTIIAVQVQEPVEEGRRYAARYGLEYLIGADTGGHVFRAYRVYALPTQFFVDPDGVIRAIVNGPLDEASASRLIESLLPEPSPTR